MQKKICFILTLTAIYVTESSPVNLGTLEFDNLDTDLSKIGYEVEEEDLDDYSQLFDKPAATSKPTSVKANDSEKSTLNVNNSGYKKTNTEKKGTNRKHNIGNVEKLLKAVGGHDQGSYDDANVYALAEGVGAAAIASDGDASRTFKKGSKTRGFHRVHHKDEYKKDQQFYEDDEINGRVKKVGSKTVGVKLGSGIGFDKGHFHHDRHKGIYGKRGYLDKGYLDAVNNEYSDSQGYEASFANDS